MRSLLLFVAAVASTACASKAAPANPQDPAPKNPVATTRTVRETVTVRDPEIERRLHRAELRVIEKEAQVAVLQERLEDARDEVVRTMGKLQTLASRAEAASAMAEADVAHQSLRNMDGARQLPELALVAKFVQESSSEFNKQNYGGALYLADQAKSAAAAARQRLAGGARNLRQGETPFAVPVRLKVANRGNVREGPGTSFPVAFAVEAGNGLTGFSYTDEWVRVTDDAGKSGWIFRPLVTRP